MCTRRSPERDAQPDRLRVAGRRQVLRWVIAGPAAQVARWSAGGVSLAGLASPSPAWAGGQVEEPLAMAVRGALSAAVADSA
ncbi:MAG: hypothetical protein AB9M60_05720, partial [Leptothrix sp. (in: b-proteobacteria)]